MQGVHFRNGVSHPLHACSPMIGWHAAKCRQMSPRVFISAVRTNSSAAGVQIHAKSTRKRWKRGSFTPQFGEREPCRGNKSYLCESRSGSLYAVLCVEWQSSVSCCERESSVVDQTVTGVHGSRVQDDKSPHFVMPMGFSSARQLSAYAGGN